jgi:hypothetical protein
MELIEKDYDYLVSKLFTGDIKNFTLYIDKKNGGCNDLKESLEVIEDVMVQGLKDALYFKIDRSWVYQMFATFDNLTKFYNDRYKTE